MCYALTNNNMNSSVQVSKGYEDQVKTPLYVYDVGIY